MIHGQLDYRVPDAQGLAYYNTLKAKGVPARLVFFPDENHWILKPQNSRLWYREFEAWLKRFARPGGRRARLEQVEGDAEDHAHPGGDRGAHVDEPRGHETLAREPEVGSPDGDEERECRADLPLRRRQPQNAPRGERGNHRQAQRDGARAFRADCSCNPRPASMPPRKDRMTAANVTNAAIAGTRMCD